MVSVSKNIRRMKFRNFSWFGLHTPDFGILRNFEMETKISIFLGHFFWFTRLPEENRLFWTEREFFLFWLFWWFPFLSLLSKRNNILIKNKNTKRHNKKGKVPSSIERRLFGLFLLSYFSISATHSRSFVCSRQIVEEKKELSFFLSLSKVPEEDEKREDEKREKKSSSLLSLFLIEKAKTSSPFARVPKKQEEEEEEEKTQKRRGG